MVWCLSSVVCFCCVGMLFIPAFFFAFVSFSGVRWFGVRMVWCGLWFVLCWHVFVRSFCFSFFSFLFHCQSGSLVSELCCMICIVLACHYCSFLLSSLLFFFFRCWVVWCLSGEIFFCVGMFLCLFLLQFLLFFLVSGDFVCEWCGVVCFVLTCTFLSLLSSLLFISFSDVWWFGSMVSE